MCFFCKRKEYVSVIVILGVFLVVNAHFVYISFTKIILYYSLEPTPTVFNRILIKKYKKSHKEIYPVKDIHYACVSV